MSPADILNPHSEAELAKAIKLECYWFGSEAAETATTEVLLQHCHHMKGLLLDLDIERAAMRSLRRDAKGVEIKHKNARSWHK